MPTVIMLGVIMVSSNMMMITMAAIVDLPACLGEDALMQDLPPSLPKSLGDLCESLVFVGGCATGLLLTTPRAQAIRATQDVDVVVHAISAAEIHALLEDRNFLMALAGHLPGDAASQARLPELIRRMRAIGNMKK